MCLIPAQSVPVHGSSSTGSPAHSVEAQSLVLCLLYTLFTWTTFQEVHSCHTPYTGIVHRENDNVIAKYQKYIFRPTLRDRIYYSKLTINMTILKKKKGVNLREDMNSETNRHCSMHCYNRRYRKCRHTTVYIRPSAYSPWWRVLSLLLLLFHMSKTTICTSCFKWAGWSINYSSELLKTFKYDIFLPYAIIHWREVRDSRSRIFHLLLS